MNEPKSTFSTISIVVPIYNESNYVAIVLQRLLDVVLPGDLRKEIIVVDDGSSDGSADIASGFKKNGVKVLRHEKNKGKGAALISGFAECSGEIITIQDSDLEYDPNDLTRLLQPILDGRADTVFGARAGLLGGECHRVMFFGHFVANRFLTLLCNVVSGLTLSDMECCYKVFKRSIISKVVLAEKRFGFEPEVVIKVARLGCPIYQVSVSYSGRTYDQGKKIKWQDGARALWCIFKYGVLRR